MDATHYGVESLAADIREARPDLASQVHVILRSFRDEQISVQEAWHALTDVAPEEG
jgi:hypothetical protein